jgi:hypothetical protein
MPRGPDYAENYEILMAVVTHLAVGKWPSRQPKGIAKDLSIDVESIRPVLKAFKGLFRESQGLSKDHGEPFYSLHLRYARTGGDADEERPALEPTDLFSLLKFVSEKSTLQSQQTVALRLAALTSIISLLVAAASMVVALHKG